jgi:hypothetical protein
MSVATPPAPGGGPPVGAPAPSRSREACPLCGTPLQRDQEWCLHCGAAARTRLAPSPRWKWPIVTFAIVVVLSLGVLAAALVHLAGGSSSNAPAITRTVTAAASVASTATGVATAPTGTSSATTGKAQANKPASAGAGAPKAATGAPRTSVAPAPSSGRRAAPPAFGQKLSPKNRREIGRAIREQLRKSSHGKLLPSPNTE